MIFHSIGRVQLLRHQWLLFVGQMVEHIAPLMNLTALDRRRLASVLFHRAAERLAAIQQVQSGLTEIQFTIRQVAQ